MKVFAFKLLFLAVTICSCENSKDEDTTIKNFALLPSGRSMSYYVDNNNNPLSYQFYDTLQFNGVHVYLYNIQNEKSYIYKGNVSSLIFVRNDSLFYAQSLSYANGKMTELLGTELILPSTFKKGAKWKFRNYQVEVESVNETISTLAGSFECVRINVENGIYLWLSRNHGVIKIASGNNFLLLKNIISF